MYTNETPATIKVVNIFIVPRNFPLTHTPSYSTFQATTDLLSDTKNCLQVLEFKINNFIQYVLFATWFLSISIIILRCNLVVFIWIVHYFLLVSSIPLCGYTTVCQSMNVLMIIRFWLCQIKLQGTFLNDPFYEHRFSSLLGIFWGVGFLQHVVSICLTF